MNGDHMPRPDTDALAAAARLQALGDAYRASHATPRPADEPPTGLLDLAAIRARLDLEDVGNADPAALAWLDGGAAPAAVALVDQVTALPPVPTPRTDDHESWIMGLAAAGPRCGCYRHDHDRCAALGCGCPAVLQPAPVWHCHQLGNGVHRDGPCGPQHTAADLDPAPYSEIAAALTDIGLAAAAEIASGNHPFPEVIAEVDPCPRCGARECAGLCADEPVFGSEHPTGGWRSRHDPRSRHYRSADRTPGAAPLRDHLWPTGPVLDQGAEGACVGFGITDAVNVLRLAHLREDLLTADDARALYQQAQRLDDVPGEAYSGTSVLAGLSAARAAGDLGGYLWAFGTAELAQALLTTGPVVIGIPWPVSWMNPGADGLLTLGPAEDMSAGHCLAVVGIRLTGPHAAAGPYFVLQNSYGPGWGDAGRGYVHHRDLGLLLAQGGEAAVPTLTGQAPR